MGSKGNGDQDRLSGFEYPKPGEPESSPDPAAVGRRIAQLRGKRTQDEFARELGIHSNTLGRYERGERLPDGELLIALSRVCGVSSDWVLFGLPPMSLEEASNRGMRSLAIARYHSQGLQEQLRDEAQRENMVYVPLYDIEVGAGRGKVAPECERILTYRIFDRDWLLRELQATEADVYLVKVRGDSNYGVVNDGDIVLIDKRIHEINKEDCYLIRIEDALALKFGQRLPGGLLRFWGTNEAVSPSFTVNIHDPGVADSFSVLGLAYWRGGKIVR